MSGGPSSGAPLLSARELRKVFQVRRGWRQESHPAVQGVSLDLWPGEIVALVGESGSGKTTVGRMMVRLLQPSGGELIFAGRNVLQHERRRASLGFRAAVQMIFQDPFAALNPVHTVGYHLERPLRIHKKAPTRATCRQAVLELLERVGLRPAEEVAKKYPHQLSGGQRQRVCLARALAVDPALIVADEPTSMLDASIQRDILDLLRSLQAARGLGFLYITHDLGVARRLADRVVVLLGGRVVESGPTAQVLQEPAHPYTRLLLEAVPDPDRRAHYLTKVAPRAGGGTPSGCVFADRCERVTADCRDNLPALEAITPERLVRCLHPGL